MPTILAMFWGAACANVFSACASAPPPPASSANRLLGEPLPAFERRTVQGGKVASDPARGLVVVDFFAEYCRPCQRSLPALEALHRARPELAIVGVSLDEDVIATRRTILRHGITFPVVHDPQHVLAGRFRVADLPICFLSDRGGRVRWVGGPEQPHGALARAVAAIIDGTKEE